MLEHEGAVRAGAIDHEPIDDTGDLPGAATDLTAATQPSPV